VTYLLAIFLILGIVYFLKKLSEPEKPAPTVIVELKMPEVQPATQQIEQAPQSDDDKYWDGPAPTHEQRRQTLNRFVEFFKKFPESPLKDSYPQQANMAAALLRYDLLEFQLQNGVISRETYDEEIEKILPLIDISEDLPE
jgi:hypothetical protein